MIPISVKKLRPNAIIPTYGSEDAAGADLYACLEEAVTIAPGESAWIPTGIAMALPKCIMPDWFTPAAAWHASWDLPLPTRSVSSTVITAEKSP